MIMIRARQIDYLHMNWETQIIESQRLNWSSSEYQSAEYHAFDDGASSETFINGLWNTFTSMTNSVKTVGAALRMPNTMIGSIQ